MKQNKLTFYLAASTLALLLTVVSQNTDIGNLRQKVKQHESINKELVDSVHTYKNKYGEEVAKRAAAEADVKLLMTTYAEKFDWIKQHTGIQEKNVRGIFTAVTKANYTGGGVMDTLVFEHDILTMGFQQSSPWFNLDANIILKPASPPQLQYTFESRDSVTLVPYRVGKNLFVKGISANPYAKISGLQGILVATDPKKRRWGIGPSIQIGYDTQLRITPGISVQYSLIRF